MLKNSVTNEGPTALHFSHSHDDFILKDHKNKLSKTKLTSSDSSVQSNIDLSSPLSQSSIKR